MPKSHNTRHTRPTITRLVVVLVLALTPVLAPDHARADPAQVRSHIGYGISVAPHLPSRPDLLDELGMNWVKVYDTEQIPDYPHQRVLYRVDVRGYPDNIEGWETGLHDLARQLQGLGVAAVEIGNEPNLTSEWGGRSPNASEFTDTLCRAYRVFKATAPKIVVVSGGLAPGDNDLDFAQQMLNSGAGKCFDAWGYHAYGFNQPPEADPNQHAFSFRRTERMYRLLWNNGIRDRQIWITEFGWVRDPAEGGYTCADDPTFRDFNWMKVSAQTQATYTARAFQFADANWSWAGPMFLWNLNWSLYETSYEPDCSHLRWYAILDRNGARLPVFEAVKRVDKRIPAKYSPSVGAVVHGMTRTAQAGCAGQMRVGSFTVINAGYPGYLEVEIEPANGPGRPLVWTSTDEGVSGTEVEVFVDSTGIEPGLHLIAVNLRTVGSWRISSHAVRGWLLIHYPTSPECVSRFKKQSEEPQQ